MKKSAASNLEREMSFCSKNQDTFSLGINVLQPNQVIFFGVTYYIAKY